MTAFVWGFLLGSMVTTLGLMLWAIRDGRQA